MRVQTGSSLGRFLLTICLQSAKNLKRVHLRPKEGPREQHWAASAFVTRATLCSPTLDCYHRNQYTSSYVHVPADGGAGASPIPACAGAAPLQDPFGEISKSRFSAHAVDRPRRRAASPPCGSFFIGGGSVAAAARRRALRKFEFELEIRTSQPQSQFNRHILHIQYVQTELKRVHAVHAST